MDAKKREAVEEMVRREFQSIPTSMIATYLQANEEGINDITPLSVNRIYHLYDTGEEVEVLSYDSSKDTYMVKDEAGNEREIQNFEVEECDYHGRNLPEWGTMWLCERRDWINHIKALADSGFTVYDIENEPRLLVGINGGGYDFYESHWGPLYDRRGFQWHLIEENTVDTAKAVALAVSLGGKPEKIAKALDISVDVIKKYAPAPVR